jgi:hypothetical protein
VVELAVTMPEGQDELGRVLIAGDTDHDAVDRALALDLDPTVLAARDVATIGTFGDNAPDGCQDRQPLLGDFSIARLDYQLQIRMKPVEQALEFSPSGAHRCRTQILTVQCEQVEAEQHGWTLEADLGSISPGHPEP